MTSSEHLTRLASTFTVRDIMVGIGDLVCATSESEAALTSESWSDFSLIPILHGDILSEYYFRDSQKVIEIEVSDLIGDGTGVLDLVDILATREFVFVLGPKRIDGYVHFSDLNRSLVKFAFYVLLEGVERFAMDSVGRSMTDDSFLEATLGIERLSQVRRSFQRAGNARQSLANYFNIADALRLVRAGGKVEIDDSMIQAVQRIRNAAAHALENLVNDYEDVTKLAQVKSECLRILQLS